MCGLPFSCTVTSCALLRVLSWLPCLKRCCLALKFSPHGCLFQQQLLGIVPVIKAISVSRRCRWGGRGRAGAGRQGHMWPQLAAEATTAELSRAMEAPGRPHFETLCQLKDRLWRFAIHLLWPRLGKGPMTRAAFGPVLALLCVHALVGHHAAKAVAPRAQDLSQVSHIVAATSPARSLVDACDHLLPAK
jgi:hypothetical protein